MCQSWSIDIDFLGFIKIELWRHFCRLARPSFRVRLFAFLNARHVDQRQTCKCRTHFSSAYGTDSTGKLIRNDLKLIFLWYQRNICSWQPFSKPMHSPKMLHSFSGRAKRCYVSNSLVAGKKQTSWLPKVAH